jgi:hypothetical protein
MTNGKLTVFQFEHPLKSDLERLWTIEADLARTLQALELLIGPPEFFRVAGYFASALYTQALVSYVRCFTSGRRKGLERSLLEEHPELLKIHDDIKEIRDRHVSHPVSDYERCNLLVAAESADSPARGLGVHHLFFSGAGPQDLKNFRKLVSFVHRQITAQLNQVGNQIAKEAIGKRATWKSAQKNFWSSVSGEDVYGPGW